MSQNSILVAAILNIAQQPGSIFVTSFRPTDLAGISVRFDLYCCFVCIHGSQISACTALNCFSKSRKDVDGLRTKAFHRPSSLEEMILPRIWLVYKLWQPREKIFTKTLANLDGKFEPKILTQNVPILYRGK